MASATAIAAGGLFIADFAVGPYGLRIWLFNPIPLGVILMGSVLAFVQLVAVRLYPRVFYEMSLRSGAPDAGGHRGDRRGGRGARGAHLALGTMETQVVGFISDSREEVGRHIEGAPVLGVVEDLEGLITRHGIDQVIVAKPQASREEMDWIWRTSTQTSAE